MMVIRSGLYFILRLRCEIELPSNFLLSWKSILYQRSTLNWVRLPHTVNFASDQRSSNMQGQTNQAFLFHFKVQCNTTYNQILMSSLLLFSPNKVLIISVTGKHLITFTQRSSMTVTMSQKESSILAQTMVLTSNVWYWLATVLAASWLQQFLIILQRSLRSTVDGIFLELRYAVELHTESCVIQNRNSSHWLAFISFLFSCEK